VNLGFIDGPGALPVHFDPADLLIFPVFVLSVVVHECAHGLVALWHGDPTARDSGRLTLNPLRHIDPVGSLLLPGALMLFHSPVVFGWAKPVPLQWANLRSPRNDPAKVALAGPASNVLLALAFSALARWAPDSGFFAPLGEMAYAGVVLNCALGIFNLIPIPPLDGSWVLMRFLRLRHIIALQHFRFVGLGLVALLLGSPLTSHLFYGPLRLAVHACLDLCGVPRAGSPL
jgi:Zn-dependent protease